MFDKRKPIYREAEIFAALWPAGTRRLALRGMRELAWMSEQLTRRYENACNYAWATTERYAEHTGAMERGAVAVASILGLHCYLQTDPRGATVYVSRDLVDDQTYNAPGVHCIFYGD